MARYVIGDLHGHLDTFLRLLERLDYRADRDRLIFVGDIVNRGPDCSGTLERVQAHCRLEGAACVLGNHDLHLIGCILGVRVVRPSDTIDGILRSRAQKERALSWLRTLPLVHEEDDALILHAGLLPFWEGNTLREVAHDLARTIREDEDELRTLVDPALPLPLRGDEALSAAQRRAFELAVLTRIRTCSDPRTPEWRFKRPLEELPSGLAPWFAVPDAPPAVGKPVLFGHWAALGPHITPIAKCIDTGCAWGRELSAWDLDEARLISVPAK